MYLCRCSKARRIGQGPLLPIEDGSLLSTGRVLFRVLSLSPESLGHEHCGYDSGETDGQGGKAWEKVRPACTQAAMHEKTTQTRTAQCAVRCWTRLRRHIACIRQIEARHQPLNL